MHSVTSAATSSTRRGSHSQCSGATATGRLVEECAPPLLVPGSYIEPFALRALGRVRNDADLVERAAARFADVGLEWHARATHALLVS
jgi:hypothetical protein